MKYTLRAPAVALVAIAFFGVGVIGVQASPTCQRFVRTYTEKVTNHRIAKATLQRWAEWNKAHPNYHPPAKRRPELTPQETVAKLDFACELPLLPADSDFVLPMLPPLEFTVPAEFLATNTFTPVAPVFTLVGAPVVAPIAPIEVPVPEPSGLLLLGTAAALLFLFRKRIAQYRASVAA